MADRNQVEQIVERVVSQLLQGHFTQLREELVRRVLDELPQESRASASQESAGAAPADLLRAVCAIHAGTTQKEILRALLDGLSHYCGRTALFVIKGGASTGWQGRGFEDNDAVKEFVLNTSRGLPERVLQEKAAFSGQVMDMDPRFVDQFGSPADDHIIMLPRLRPNTGPRPRPLPHTNLRQRPKRRRPKWYQRLPPTPKALRAEPARRSAK